MMENQRYPITTIADAMNIIVSLSKPGKMPCYGYSIPADLCQLGSRLAGIEGSACHDCYARVGWYPARRKYLIQRYDSLKDPQWVEAMSFTINKMKMEYFRWHDSGDLQGVWHLENICEVADATPDTKHWLPTTEWYIVEQYWKKRGKIPLYQLHPNLVIRLSAFMLNGTVPLKISRRLGVQVSNVSDKDDHNCFAQSRPRIRNGIWGYKVRGGMCGSCRDCWDPAKESITYKFHKAHPGRPRKPSVDLKATKGMDVVEVYQYLKRLEAAA